MAIYLVWLGKLAIFSDTHPSKDGNGSARCFRSSFHLSCFLRVAAQLYHLDSANQAWGALDIAAGTWSRRSDPLEHFAVNHRWISAKFKLGHLCFQQPLLILKIFSVISSGLFQLGEWSSTVGRRRFPDLEVGIHLSSHACHGDGYESIFIGISHIHCSIWDGWPYTIYIYTIHILSIYWYYPKKQSLILTHISVPAERWLQTQLGWSPVETLLSTYLAIFDFVGWMLVIPCPTMCWIPKCRTIRDAQESTEFPKNNPDLLADAPQLGFVWR